MTGGIDEIKQAAIEAQETIANAGECESLINKHDSFKAGALEFYNEYTSVKANEKAWNMFSQENKDYLTATYQRIVDGLPTSR